MAGAAPILASRPSAEKSVACPTGGGGKRRRPSGPRRLRRGASRNDVNVHAPSQGYKTCLRQRKHGTRRQPRPPRAERPRRRDQRTTRASSYPAPRRLCARQHSLGFHHSIVGPSHGSIHGPRRGGSGGLIVQNKANWEGGKMGANWRSGKDLGRNHRDHAAGKTKPIPRARIARPTPRTEGKTCLRGRKHGTRGPSFTPGFQCSIISLWARPAEGPIVPNKANSPGPRVTLSVAMQRD
jgi:hypothetical protein